MELNLKDPNYIKCIKLINDKEFFIKAFIIYYNNPDIDKKYIIKNINKVLNNKDDCFKLLYIKKEGNSYELTNYGKYIYKEYFEGLKISKYAFERVTNSELKLMKGVK